MQSNVEVTVKNCKSALQLFNCTVVLCYPCVPRKHSLARNSLGWGLFYVVNVLRYFKIA